MGTQTDSFKCIVTALVLTVGYSLPAVGATLDELFDDLAAAEDGGGARIERQIVGIWEKSGSPSFDMLLRRGKDALSAGAPDVALDHFSALVDHAPDFAAGYNGRATAYFLLGMTGPALDDLRQTLVLNPRHFGAMRGVGVILEDLGRPKDALDVYRAILALNPGSIDIQEAADRLELELEGQAL
ncbi:MAG: tetratricopeptide (TPR) repeat protein [Yoonia sp.]|jgi:tetratricopeptide (TPR) repeat protein